MKRGQTPRSGPGTQHALPTRFGGFASQQSASTLSYLAEPPSISSISNPHVVVMLKNVLKKDSTTKGRALEELVGHVQEANEDVEDALLDVWVQIYPRISIDNSRRVRELSHTLQFELLKSGRKRMERRLSGIVASWLAGSFDRDRAVARAANAGLTSFLDTPEKLKAFWLKCQSQILDFAIEAIHETHDTLSDERTTTREDADTKYFRVVYAGLCLGLGLLQRVPADSLSHYQSQYEQFLGDDTIWKLIEAPDSSVRKAVCHLMFACLDRSLPYANTKQARDAFVLGGLRKTQTGTALEYVRALSKLTEAHPEIWTEVQRKKSPFSRLCAFITKGSQGSPPKFWEQLDNFLQKLPGSFQGVSGLEHALELIGSLQSGIRNREEPRTNTSFAWKCYIDTAKRLSANLSPGDQLVFASDTLFPLFERFLFSTPGSDDGIPLGPNAMAMLVEAHNALAQSSDETQAALVNEWDKLAAIFCSNIAGVLPEVSKDFQTSQERLSEEGRRWFGLVGELRSDCDELSTASIVTEPSRKVVTLCFQLLKSRNMKPYGVARVLEFALSSSRHLFDGALGSQCIELLSSVPGNDVETMVKSPSALSLISSLQLIRGIPAHNTIAKEVWEAWMKLILELPPSPTRTSAVVQMISSNDISRLVQETATLQDEISNQIVRAGRDSAHDWNLMDAAIQYDAMSSSTIRRVALELIALLDEDQAHTSSLLVALEKLVKAHRTTFVEDETLHTGLVRHLIGLKETQNSDVSSKVSRIRSLLGEDLRSTLLPIVTIIQQNLDSAGPHCLNVELLAQQAQDALEGGASEDDIFPNTNSFIESLLPFLRKPVDPAMAIMNSIGDTVFLVSHPDDPSTYRPPPRDSDGRSIPARMALYVCHLLDKGHKISALPTKFQVEVLYLQALVAQLVSDQMSLDAHDGLWLSLDSPAALSQVEWLVSTSRRQLLALTESCTDWSDTIESQSNIMPQVVKFLSQQSMALTPTALYSSRVLVEIFQTVVEKNGLPSAWEEKFLTPDVLKGAPDRALLTAALLSGMGISLRPLKSVNTLCNRLVSDITAAKASTEKSTVTLSLMTLCGSIYDAGLLPIPSNRVVFAVKQITDWLEDDSELSHEFASACLRCLGQLLPCIKEVYGSVWEKTLQYCVKSWERVSQYSPSSVLPLLHASLKLTRELQDMEDVNDDLEEALSVFSKQKGARLVNLLRLDRGVHSQPQEIVDRLLCREVEKLSKSQLPEPEDLYGLIASESEVVQTAAFTMLHRIIPEQQEQKSVDILLDKSDARLPDELLSLLLDAPTLEQFSDEVLSTFPLSIRGYLLSWKLIFDAYAASPSKIRMDFTEGIETDNPVNPLLDFMFDVLGHSAGYPLKLDKEKITRDHIRDFDIRLAEAEQEEMSMHWLLSHLFYLTLKYLPGLFRRWFQDCRSKQTKMAVESWTETFFSPLIIEEALEEVQIWADSTDFDAPGEAELIIKVSKGGKEVSVSYEIDESQGGISIKLPNGFPLDGVTVKGIRRVAVDDRKWQSWIMTTQGVITFSNGNIIDGIQAFRRNLTGALQGHTECAICYSVISSDQRVPEKNCTTCKNLFHRLCLYKWFQTSNNNTCPLCRTPIDFAGATGLKRRNLQHP